MALTTFVVLAVAHSDMRGHFGTEVLTVPEERLPRLMVHDLVIPDVLSFVSSCDGIPVLISVTMAKTYVACMMDKVSAEVLDFCPFRCVEFGDEVAARYLGCLFHNTELFLQSNVCSLFEIVHHNVIREIEDTQPQGIIVSFASCVERCFEHGARVHKVVQNRECCSIVVAKGHGFYTWRSLFKTSFEQHREVRGGRRK
jgi:hypothetical protein